MTAPSSNIAMTDLTDAELETFHATQRATASNFAAAGTGGFIVQHLATWKDYPDWDDHGYCGNLQAGREVRLAFATIEHAEAYIAATVELEYRVQRERWQTAHEAWLPRIGRYQQRRKVLEQHNLWAAPDERTQPLIYPAGPGPEPERDLDSWRVVPYRNSDRARWDDEPHQQIRWCENCSGHVGVDVDCSDNTHRHAWQTASSDR
jgi:hypothetical protein